MTVTIHATDLTPGAGQRHITAVCGRRPSVNRAVSIIWFAELPGRKGHPAEVACVGCRAILIERRREAERARRHAGLAETE
jgi:hypothetical protein